MTPEEAFGRVLQELRREAGLSQEKLAEAVDCTRPSISYLEHGIYSPSVSLLFRLAAALRVTPTEVIARVEAQADEPSKRVTRPRERHDL